MDIVTNTGMQSMEIYTTVSVGVGASNFMNPVDAFGEIDTSNVADGYVFSYKADTQKYGFESSDELLIKAVEDNTLPQVFINKLDDELDNRIDSDGGVF